MSYPFSKLRWLRKYPPDAKSAGKTNHPRRALKYFATL
jgi:hypothetical protein